MWDTSSSAASQNEVAEGGLGRLRLGGRRGSRGEGGGGRRRAGDAGGGGRGEGGGRGNVKGEQGGRERPGWEERDGGWRGDGVGVRGETGGSWLGWGLSSWSPPCGDSTESTLSAACNMTSQTLEADTATGKERLFGKSTDTRSLTCLRKDRGEGLDVGGAMRGGVRVRGGRG